MLLGRFDLLAVADLHVDVAQVRAANHALHRARVRHDHDVILVYTLSAQSLGREDTEDREWHVFNSQNLANGIFVTVDLCRSRAADHANFVRAAHVLWRKWRAVCQRPLPNIKIICRLAVNAGKPVLVSCSHLRGRNNFRTHSDDAGHFAPNRFGVFNFESTRAAPASANPARGGAAGKNEDHILSEAGDLRLDLRFRAVADSNHRDDRADTDDNSERGQD